MQAIHYKVVEIFDSIEGEGKRAGLPASFIRLAGCNLRCSYCDTDYALEETSPSTLMTIEEIKTLLNRRRFFRVTITGGEPLLTQNINELITALSCCEINIETNGSINITPYLNHQNLFFTIDYKLPSSGETSKMLTENYNKLRQKDVLKFVVGRESDIPHMVKIIENLKSNPQIYIGTVYQKYPLQALVNHMLSIPALQNANLQLQFHKIIWPAAKRGV